MDHCTPKSTAYVYKLILMEIDKVATNNKSQFSNKYCTNSQIYENHSAFDENI